MVRSLLQLASPAGSRARLSILVLHRVVPGPDPLYPEAMDAPRFDALCAWVASLFNVLPLDEAVTRLRQRTLPARALAITFDDGYADNAQIALPILQRHGLAATVFVATGYLDGGRMWNDTLIESLRRSPLAELDLTGLQAAGEGRHPLGTPLQRRIAIEALIKHVKYLAPAHREAVVAAIAERTRSRLPDDLMLSSAQVRQLRHAGMQIGAHTVTHPILAKLPIDAARREMLQSKQRLEALLEERVGLFAYPNGKPGEDYNAESVALARTLGFDAAVTTARGAAGPTSDLHELPRFTPWDRTRLRFGARMLGTIWSSRTAAAAAA